MNEAYPATSSEERQPSGNSQLPLWPADAQLPVADNVVASGVPEDTPAPGPPVGDPPWNLFDLGAFVVFGILTLLLANLSTAAVFLLVRTLMGWHMRVADALMKTPFVVSMQVLWELLWFLFIYYVIAVKYRRPFWSAIHWQRPRHSIYGYVAGGILLAGAAQALLNLLPAQKELPVERLFTSAASSYLLALFGICIAPFMEELVFRGFFYPVFERQWGLLRAVLLTSALFAVIHGPQLNGGWAEMIVIFLVGVALSYTRGKTGSLVPSYLMHLAYNSSLFVSLYLTTDRFHALKG
jgi:CAAX protease family protein